MKKLFIMILCLSLLLTCVGCGEKPSDKDTSNDAKKTYKVKAAEVISKFDDEGNVIICWGDSITQGMAMAEGFTYPQHLQGHIGSDYRVINAGVPGEDTDAILSRANAIEYCLTYDIVFDKGEKQYTMDRYMFTRPNAPMSITYKGFGNELKLGKVIIGGKPYTIEYAEGATHDNGLYRLTRTDTSKPLTIKAGTKAKFDYTGQYKNIHCNVILIGANDSNEGAEKLIEKYKKLSEMNENYIAIVPFYSEDFSKEFAEAFGDKALSVREYFMYQAHKDYGIELTKLDEYCVKKGMIPGSYNYKGERGGYNLNEIGYKILADQVYKKGQELGYWK